MSPHTLRDSPSTWLPPCPVQHPQTYGSAQASEGAKQDSCNISIQWGLVGETSLIFSSYLPFRLIRHELLCNCSLSATEMSIIGHFPGWDCHKNPHPLPTYPTSSRDGSWPPRCHECQHSVETRRQIGLFHLTFAWNAAKLHQYTLHGNFCPVYIKGAPVIFCQHLGPPSPYCWVSERKSPLIPTPSPSQYSVHHFKVPGFEAGETAQPKEKGTKLFYPGACPIL